MKETVHYLQTVAKNGSASPAQPLTVNKQTAESDKPPRPPPKPRWTVTASTKALAMNKQHRAQSKMKEALVILVVAFVVAIGLQYLDDYLPGRQNHVT